MTNQDSKLKMTELADRIRTIIGDDPNIGEKKMFGGICFLLNGNMLCGPTNKGQMMLRVGKENWQGALTEPHTHEMDFTGKSLTGFVFVDEEGIKDEASLKDWIARATTFVATLPAK